MPPSLSHSSAWRFTHFPHVVPGVFTTETGINTTGAAVAWIAGLLYGRAGRVTEREYTLLGDEAAAVAAGSDGVVALPALGDGDRRDADIRAALVGLSVRHDRSVIARAMLEAVAFGIKGQLETLSKFTPVTELRVSGGGAKNSRLGSDQGGCDRSAGGVHPRGCCESRRGILAGLGTGIYGSIGEAVNRCVQRYPIAVPSEASRDAYDAAYRRYRELEASHVVRQERMTGVE